MKSIYEKIISLLRPLITKLGKFHVPFSRKKINGKDYFLWRDKINIGTVFLTSTRGELSNIFNPSGLKHSGLYVGDISGDGINYVLEAIGRGVVLTDLVTFLTTKDVIVGVEYKSKETNFENRIIEYANSTLGKSYDFGFSLGNDSYYCFELSAGAIRFASGGIDLRQEEVLKDFYIYDGNTFFDNSVFKTIIDSREV